MKIINESQFEWHTNENGDFSYFRKQLGQLAGGKMLGASLFKLMPGKKAFPYHCHYANEEAIFVLEGKATLRINNEKYLITEGDYVAFPKGPDFAHQVINTSPEVFIYLCISTMIHPEVMEYPDSDKIGIMLGAAPGDKKNKQLLKAFFKKEQNVDYFEDE